MQFYPQRKKGFIFNEDVAEELGVLMNIKCIKMITIMIHWLKHLIKNLVLNPSIQNTLSGKKVDINFTFTKKRKIVEEPQPKGKPNPNKPILPRVKMVH